MMESKVEEKKTSNEILIELFGAFNAAPPSLDDPKETKSSHKKSKKSKKSKKKKSKKHKKKSSESEDVHHKKKKKKSSKIEVPIDEIPQALDILLEDNKTEPTLPLPISLPSDNGNANHINPEESNGVSTDPTNEVLVKSSDDPKPVEIDENKPITPPIKIVEACPAEKKKGKIQFSNLKNSAVFQETVRAVEELQKKVEEKKSKYEEGELSDSSISTVSLKGEVAEEELELEEDVPLVLTKQIRKRSRSRSRSKNRHKRDREVKKIRKLSPIRSSHKKRRSRSRESRHSSGHISSHYDRSSYRSERHHSPVHRSRSRRDSPLRERKSHKEKKRQSESENRKTRENPRDRSNSQESSHDPDKIDKKKLLAIARKNALKLIDAGIVSADKLPTIASGGKTVNELTEYCKKISKREAMGDDLSDIESGSSEDDEKAFHHPFQVRDRPNSIVMNIKNAIPLPVKSFHEKAVEQSKILRLQFPVSSGSTHRLTESEWVPVEPVKEQQKLKNEKYAATTAVEISNPPLPKTTAPLPIMPPPMPPAALASHLIPSAAPVYCPLSAVPPPLPPTPEFPVIQPATCSAETPATLDINSIVTKRLNALRKLQENPKDNRAKHQISHTEIQFGKWTRIANNNERQEETGAFTGSTGARILSAAQLSSGTQAWAKRDQLLTAQPVRGGMGMALLQKMGWQPGEGLGKNKEGTLEPLRLEVKTDKKGLVATDEAWKGKTVGPTLPTVKTLDGKHPVSFLNEYCSRRHWGQPVFELAEEFGPDHKKNFLIKVKVNGVEYQPSVASINKKQAKAEAAAICLRALGLITTPST